MSDISREAYFYRYRILLFLIPILLTALVFYPVSGYELVWDDKLWVGKFSRLVSISDALALCFYEPSIGFFYRPLALFSFYLSSPEQWHSVSLLLYVLSVLFLTCTMYLLVCRSTFTAFQNSHLLLIFSLTLLVAFHPANVELVTWVSARFDLLLVFFALLIFMVDLLPLSKGKIACLQFCFFMSALFSKETAVVVLMVLPFWHYLTQVNRARDFKKVFLENIKLYLLLGFGVIIFLACWYLVVGIEYVSHREVEHKLYNGGQGYFQVLLLTFARFLQLIFYPYHSLSPVYYYADSGSTFTLYVYVILFFSLLLYLGIKKHRFFVIGIAFLLLLFPYLNWMQINIFGNIIQNRYVSLLIFLLPLFLLASSPCVLIGRGFYWLCGGVIVLCLSFLMTVMSILPNWSNSYSFWKWNVEENPSAYMSLNNFGLELYKRGDFSGAQSFAEQSLEINENFWSYQLLTKVCIQLGQYNDAMSFAEKAVKLKAYQRDKLYFYLYVIDFHIQVGSKAGALKWLNEAIAAGLDKDTKLAKSLMNAIEQLN